MQTFNFLFFFAIGIEEANQLKNWALQERGSEQSSQVWISN